MDDSTAEETRLTGPTVWTPARVFLALALVYTMTATWVNAYGVDPLTIAASGWAIAETGSPVIEPFEPLLHDGERGLAAWIVEGVDGPVAQYPPGASLTTVPFYALSSVELSTVTVVPPVGSTVPPFEMEVPPVWPATLSAVLVTALVAAVLARTLQGLGIARGTASLAALVWGVSTSAWNIASGMSWTHGPAMLAVVLGALAASRDRWFLCGLALGAGVLTRPHIAVVAAVVGVGVSVARREWGPVLRVALGSGIGLAALLAFNGVVHGEPSISGGYGSGFTERAASADVVAFGANIVAGLFAPRYGLLVWAPFLPLLVALAWRRRRDEPDWAFAFALGGLAYLLVQWKANRASGGVAFVSYRYPLAALAAAAPLLASSAIASLREPGSRRVRVALVVTFAGATVAQGIAAMTT